jgi:hypothetical protein
MHTSCARPALELDQEKWQSLMKGARLARATKHVAAMMTVTVTLHAHYVLLPYSRAGDLLNAVLTRRPFPYSLYSICNRECNKTVSRCDKLML